MLHTGFDQIINCAAGLKGFPEPPAPSVKSQNRAIPANHDHVIVQRQSNSIQAYRR